MNRINDLKVILFDLGGVLLKLNDPVEIFGLEPGDNDFKERWLRSPSVREFESGGIDTEEFARRIVLEANLPYDWQEFIRRFDRWPGHLFDDTINVLQAIPSKYSRALLSNINALHWNRDEIAGEITPHLDQTFLSFETGLVKPDRGAFELVVKTYQCRPDEVLFFDDTPSSVSAAAELGMRAEVANGIASVRSALTRRGILV